MSHLLMLHRSFLVVSAKCSAYTVFIQVEELLQSQTKETEKENVLIEELREQQQALTEYKPRPIAYP